MKFDRVIAIRNTKTVYRDGNLCIKCFLAPHSKTDVLTEALNHARMEQTELYVPALHDVTELDGKRAIVMDFIRGTTLQQKIEQEPENIEKHLAMMVTLQQNIHRQTVNGLSDQREILRRALDTAAAVVSVPQTLYKELEEFSAQRCVCHGDLEPSNILIAHDGTPYLLDWADAGYGTPAMDAAASYTAFCLQKRQDLAEQYLSLFCKASGISEHDIRALLPIAAAARIAAQNSAAKLLYQQFCEQIPKLSDQGGTSICR